MPESTLSDVRRLGKENTQEELTLKLRGSMNKTHTSELKQMQFLGKETSRGRSGHTQELGQTMRLLEEQAIRESVPRLRAVSSHRHRAALTVSCRTY